VTTGKSARSIPPRWIVSSLPIAVALHNLEEALTFGRYLPAVAAGLPVRWRPWAGPDTLSGLYVALVVATVAPLAICVWSAVAPGSLVARRLVLPSGWCSSSTPPGTPVSRCSCSMAMRPDW
jgi:hypothetical protein